jgi:Flp pilus assembly protein TadG
LSHTVAMGRDNTSERSSALLGRERGAAAVEFALVLPLLVILLLGIIDFGLYYYNDLQLTHAARDAARYLSVNNVAAANTAISGATLVSTAITTRTLNPGTSGQPATVTLRAMYTFLTPLPLVVGIGRTLGINATVVMRRE